MVLLLIVQFAFTVYCFSTNPYREVYFNILAMVDELGSFLAIALQCNSVFLSSFVTPQIITYIGYAYAGIVEIVLILNLIVLVLYYTNRKGASLEP